MIPFGGDSWTYSIGGDPDINFCVWVLVGDGLRVHPFDRHVDGDRGLRAAGLTEANWRGWFEETVRGATERQESVNADPRATHSENDDKVDLSDLLYGEAPPTPDQISKARETLLARTAAGRWPRQDQVRVELLRRWPLYRKHLKERDNRDFERSLERHRLMQSLTPEEAEELAKRERRRWDEIQQYRPLPPLHFYTVDYPSPVVETVPPASAVLGGVDGEQDSEGCNRLVLEAAKRLRAATDV